MKRSGVLLAAMSLAATAFMPPIPTNAGEDPWKRRYRGKRWAQTEGGGDPEKRKHIRLQRTVKRAEKDSR